MPTQEEVAEVCAEVHQFRTALQQQQAICGDIEQRPDLVLFALISIMKRENRNLRYLTLCTLWVALSAMLITIIPTLNSPNYILYLVVLLLALIPITIVAKY